MTQDAVPWRWHYSACLGHRLFAFACNSASVVETSREKLPPLR
jgi:hypothetical protein